MSLRVFVGTFVRARVCVYLTDEMLASRVAVSKVSESLCRLLLLTVSPTSRERNQ